MQAGLYYISFYCQVWENLNLQLHSSKPNTAQGHSKKRMHQLCQDLSYREVRLLLVQCWAACPAAAQPRANLCWAVMQVEQRLPAEPAVPGEVSLAAVCSLATRLHSPAWDAGSWDTHRSTELGAPSVPPGKTGVVGKLSPEEWQGVWVTCCTETAAKIQLIVLINWSPAKHSWEKVWTFINSFSCCHLSSLFFRHRDHPCLLIVSILVLALGKFSSALQWK